MINYTITNGKYSMELPSLTLGTANFSRNDVDESYFSILDSFVSLGGTCLDTARAYCGWLENGEGSSESVIGRWLEKNNNRDKVLICTKGGHPLFEDMSVSRLSREELESDLAKSLEALKTDYIDIYLLHRDDAALPVSEIMPILNDFVESGKVHFIGASNWTTARIEEANTFARENGMAQFSVSQINYSLAHASADVVGDTTQVCMDTHEYMWYQKHSFPVMAFSPQAKGFFSKLATGQSASNQTEGQYASTANLARLARVKKLSEDTGYSPAVISLAYLSSQTFPISSVFAVTKLWQLEEDMTAQNIKFDEKTTAFLDIKI